MAKKHVDPTNLNKLNAALLCVLIPVLMLISLSGCAVNVKNTEPVSMSGMYFDTIISVTLYDYPGSSTPILDSCKETCSHYENILSPTVEGSDIWRINHADSFPVAISADCANVIRLGLDYASRSSGLIDISVGSLTDLWDISGQAGSDDPHIPSDSEIISARLHVNCKNISLEQNPSAGKAGEEYLITLSDPEMKIETGCIAKGYIADVLKDELIKAGVKSAIINLGGNVVTVGTKPDGSPFKIGIQYPFKDRGETISTVDVSDSSLVSSGTYERYFKYGDKVYHHILDPRTGYPADSGALSASVKCASASDADALSTLCLILGPEKGIAYIESVPDTEVLYITDDYELIQSSGW